MLSPNLHRLAAYNRVGAIKQNEFGQMLTKVSLKFAEHAAGKMPDSVQKAIAGHILPHLVRADLLSVRYRDLLAVTAWLWPVMAAVAVTLMAFQIFLLPDQYWIAWIELALLLICAISYRVSLYEAWHDKWRNDRRLAEGLRSVLHSSIVMSDDEIDKDVEQDKSCWRPTSAAVVRCRAIMARRYHQTHRPQGANAICRRHRLESRPGRR
jgi:hypothetical protein